MMLVILTIPWNTKILTKMPTQFAGLGLFFASSFVLICTDRTTSYIYQFNRYKELPSSEVCSHAVVQGGEVVRGIYIHM